MHKRNSVEEQIVPIQWLHFYECFYFNIFFRSIHLVGLRFFLYDHGIYWSAERPPRRTAPLPRQLIPGDQIGLISNSNYYSGSFSFLFMLRRRPSWDERNPRLDCARLLGISFNKKWSFSQNADLFFYECNFGFRNLGSLNYYSVFILNDGDR